MDTNKGFRYKVKVISGDGLTCITRVIAVKRNSLVVAPISYHLVHRKLRLETHVVFLGRFVILDSEKETNDAVVSITDSTPDKS